MDESLLDTDALSEVLKGKDEQVLANARQDLSEHQRLTFSDITLDEIVRGMRANRAVRQLADFLKTVDTSDVFPVSRAVLLRAADHPRLSVRRWRAPAARRLTRPRPAQGSASLFR